MSTLPVKSTSNKVTIPAAFPVVFQGQSPAGEKDAKSLQTVDYHIKYIVVFHVGVVAAEVTCTVAQSLGKDSTIDGQHTPTQ